MKNLTQKIAVVSAVFSFVAVGLSQATPILRISDGVTTVAVMDNVGADGSPIGGFVQYSAPAGTFTGWSVVLTAGTTKPIIGSSIAPELDFNWTITRSGPGAGQLTLLFSENGFNLSDPATFLVSSAGTLGSSAANTALIRSYASLDNVELNLGTQLTTHAFNGPGGFAANDTGAGVLDPTFSLTLKLDLNQEAGQVSSGDIHLRTQFAPGEPTGVPESGTTITLFGTALFALGVFGVRRRELVRGMA